MPTNEQLKRLDTIPRGSTWRSMYETRLERLIPALLPSHFMGCLEELVKSLDLNARLAEQLDSANAEADRLREVLKRWKILACSPVDHVRPMSDFDRILSTDLRKDNP